MFRCDKCSSERRSSAVRNILANGRLFTFTKISTIFQTNATALAPEQRQRPLALTDPCNSICIYIILI